jgi:CRP-like cAMP-binding protein
MKRWQDALDKANDWLVDLSTGSARQRIARLLLMLGSTDEVHCELMSREDMGSMLGLTMETVSRIVAEFRRSELITKNPNGCYECKLDELEKIADG